MARPEKKPGEWGAFFSIVLMVGILATWALIPVKAIESSWRTEQETMAAWADRWLAIWSGVCNAPVGKPDRLPCLCAHDVGTDWNSLDSCGICRWAVYSGNSETLLRLPKPDSTQDRDSLFPLGERGHGGVALFASTSARFCSTIGDLFHGFFSLAMGGQLAEATLRFQSAQQIACPSRHKAQEFLV